jgi:hypothetical protein
VVQHFQQNHSLSILLLPEDARIMKLLIHPAVESPRLLKVQDAAGKMNVCNVASPADAQHEIVDSDAFFGKMTPELLAAASVFGRHR